MKINRIPIGLSLIVFATLLALPATSWLLREDLTVLAGNMSNMLDPVQPDARLASDPQVQLAVAIRQPPDNDTYPPTSVDPRIRPIHRLLTRFPGNVSIYAAALRCGVDGLALSRPDECRVEPQPCNFEQQSANPAALASYRADAAAAMRLDPGNAYFDLMAAIGEYAAHHDAAGLELIERAATAPRWQEYYAAPVYGDWRLRRDRTHGDDALQMLVSQSNMEFPELPRFRSLARIVTAQAVDDEVAGRIPVAERKRRAIRQFGALVRARSNLAVGALVGTAIINVAEHSPNGGKIVPPPTATDMPAARRQLLVSWLRANGYAADAADVERQAALNSEVKDLAEASLTIEDEVQSHILARRTHALTVLAIVFWLALSNLAVWLVSGLPGARERQPWSPPIRWGIVVALGIALVALYLFIGSANDNELSAADAVAQFPATFTFLGALIAAGILLLAIVKSVSEMSVYFKRFVDISMLALTAGLIWYFQQNPLYAEYGGLLFAGLIFGGGIASRLNRALFTRYAGVYCIVLALACACGELALWQALRIHLPEFGPIMTGADDKTEMQAVIGPAIQFIAVPAAIAFFSTAYAVICRKPAGYTHLAAGRAFLPLALFLAIVGYVFAAHAALDSNAKVAAQCRQMVASETQYYAKLCGTTWPGR